MSRDCTDKRFEKMLHLYELGLLDGNDKTEFEEHLFECDHCFEQVRQFAEVARHISLSPRVRQAVKEVTAGIDQPESALASSSVPKRSWWRTIIPSSLAAAAVLIFLILQPWQIEISPTQDAVASQNRLAIMYFTNLADPADTAHLGKIVTSLLTTDLSESEYLGVVSGQRLHDILNRIADGSDRIDADIATRVAEAARANWMLTGDILRDSEGTAITSQLVETTTGQVVSAQQVIGRPDEDLFSLVDRLTVEIKRDLALPSGALQESDPLVAEVTTHSLDAYRYYLEGVENLSRLYFVEAREDFDRALEYDSTFAMVYYYLARFWNRDFLPSAVQYADRASLKDQHYIRGFAAMADGDTERYRDELSNIIERWSDEKEAYYLLGTSQYASREYELAIENLLRATEIDPSYKDAYNMLAYAYNASGDLEHSIVAINRYIELVPGEANPYDSRGDLYAGSGQLNEAIESYEKAIQIKRDFAGFGTLGKLGHLYLYRGDYRKSKACYSDLLTAESAGTRASGRFYLSMIPLFQGRLELTLQMLDSALTMDSVEATVTHTPYKHRLKAFVYFAMGDQQAAIREMTVCAEMRAKLFPNDRIRYRYFLVQFLAESGDLETAEQVAAELLSDVKDNESLMYAYWYALGAIELVRGNEIAAAENFEKTLAIYDIFPARYMLGRALLSAGRLSEAVREFENLEVNYDSWRLCSGTMGVTLHYYLGIAYEQSRWYDRAIAQYELFLESWKDADPGLTEYNDAVKRLNRLKTRP